MTQGPGPLPSHIFIVGGDAGASWTIGITFSRIFQNLLRALLPLGWAIGDDSF
jgi:hypothetical protein